MPKLSAIPKLYTLAIASSNDPDPPPVAAVLAASEAEAWAFLRERKALRRATPAEAFELGALGVPLLHAKPEYRDNQQDELPLSGSEVAHGTP